MPKISLIMPNYNGAKFLASALRSVFGQTFKDYEIIISDDASTDKSVAVLKLYAEKDKRVKLVLSKKNQGAAAARNAALAKATGDFVMFLDSDDCLFCDAMEESLKIAQETNADIVGFGALGQDEDFKYTKRYSVEFENEVTVYDNYLGYIAKNPNTYGSAKIAPNYFSCWFVLWNKLYRRDAIKEILLDETLAIGEDVLWVAKAASIKKQKYAHLEIPLILYRNRTESLSHASTEFGLRGEINSFEKMRTAIISARHISRRSRNKIIDAYAAHSLSRIMKIIAAVSDKLDSLAKELLAENIATGHFLRHLPRRLRREMRAFAE